VVSGGVLCVFGTLARCALLPAFWAYRAGAGAGGGAGSGPPPALDDA
jgi:hypothetical protein